MIVENFENTRIQHIYQEGNKEEDFLANEGADGEDILLR